MTKHKWTVPKVRDKCKELNYKYTQEGTDYYISTKNMDLTFHRKDQLLLWFHYHIIFDAVKSK